ncbi:hypothetical protein SMIM3I_01225 [Streptococcus mitis]|uniref:Uncharacterized protein n=1 Tax=Streptococcus mitis TaxID=28037 RepID=A0A150NFI2_STRMT|nr:hypothetical protein SMIM3I_01225 [Streptococcus mitis]
MPNPTQEEQMVSFLVFLIFNEDKILENLVQKEHTKRDKNKIY